MIEQIQKAIQVILDSPLIDVLRFPFFTLGGFELSIWLLIKASILFILFEGCSSWLSQGYYSSVQTQRLMIQGVAKCYAFFFS